MIQEIIPFDLFVTVAMLCCISTAVLPIDRKK